MSPLDQLIVALDVPTRQDAIDLVERLDGSVRWVKVGLELYLAEGHAIVQELTRQGLQVFLDLKLHDIPNTVERSVRVAGTTGASLLTVHASGGPAMLEAAAAAAPAGLKLLAVTVLTSMDARELACTGVDGTPQSQVVRLGELAASAGMHGLVCSPQEITALRSSAAHALRLVVPGIRAAHSAGHDDQRRTASAGEAIRRGASMLVVGRPITRAANPGATARAFIQEIAGAQLE